MHDTIRLSRDHETRAQRADRILDRLDRLAGRLAAALDRLDDAEDRLDRQRRPRGDGWRPRRLRGAA